MITRYIILIAVVASLSNQMQGGGNPRKAFAHPSKATSEDHCYYQGFDFTVWLSNWGMMSYGPLCDRYGQGFGDFPVLGSAQLYGGVLWVGAIIDTSSSDTVKKIRSVATIYGGGSPFYVTSVDSPNGHNRRFVDDDNDGLVDEDEFNGLDDDHDGSIDEDYGAVSENDAYVAYSDTYGYPRIAGLVPLGIKIWQRSFAWKDRVKEPVLPFEFYIINVGRKVLHEVYVGFFADCDIGPRVSSYWTRNASGYFPDLHTAYSFNPIDRPPASFGVTLLGTPRPMDSLRYTFRHYPGGESPTPDINRYNMMASGIINPDEYPNLSDTRFFFSFGPFSELNPGDTLKIGLALVCGDALTETPNNFHDNAARALALYRRNFVLRSPPSAPPLHISKQYNKVTLDWKWHPGDPVADPLESWDDMDPFLDSLPPTHWRKINPPAGHTTGGRMFEGFRIWRSESPTFKPQTFALLKQFDIADDLNQEYQTGLQYTFVDSNLNPKRSYWYAVTSISIPELEKVTVPKPSGGFGSELITLSPALESAIAENATYVILSNEFRLYQSYPNPFNPSTTIVYEIPERNRVVLTVYDVLGKEVARLVDDFKSPGRYEAKWNSQGFASGVYFYRVKAGSFADVKKMLLIR